MEGGNIIRIGWKLKVDQADHWFNEENERAINFVYVGLDQFACRVFKEIHLLVI